MSRANTIRAVVHVTEMELTVRAEHDVALVMACVDRCGPRCRWEYGWVDDSDTDTLRTMIRRIRRMRRALTEAKQ